MAKQINLQTKVDKLVELIDHIKSSGAKNYALTLLSEIITIINNQEKEVKALEAYKTNNNYDEIDCELEKYVCLLIYHGYSQQYINSIRSSTLRFIAKNRKEIKLDEATNLKEIDLILMNFEFENERLPKDYNELKEYVNGTED